MVYHLRRSQNPEARTRATPGKLQGTMIETFDSARGFGWVQPDEGGDPVKVRMAAVVDASLDPPSEGQRIAFKKTKDDRDEVLAVDLEEIRA